MAHLTVIGAHNFVTPNAQDRPMALFATAIRPKTEDGPPVMPCPRFERIQDPEEMLIFADGACSNNGETFAKAGWAFAYHDAPSPAPNGTVSGRLEERGPSGQIYTQTNNRAELWAVIAALQFRHWYEEGWKRLVIATDSEYVQLGATKWVKEWTRNGWLTIRKKPVKNRDLWDLLLELISQFAEHGLKIFFWKIPQDWKYLADVAARAEFESPPMLYFREWWHDSPHGSA